MLFHSLILLLGILWLYNYDLIVQLNKKTNKTQYLTPNTVNTPICNQMAIVCL